MDVCTNPTLTLITKMDLMDLDDRKTDNLAFKLTTCRRPPASTPTTPTEDAMAAIARGRERMTMLVQVQCDYICREIASRAVALVVRGKVDIPCNIRELVLMVYSPRLVDAVFEEMKVRGFVCEFIRSKFSHQRCDVRVFYPHP